MKKKCFFSISKKMLASCQIPMIVICFVVTWLGVNTLQSSIENEIEKSLKIAAISVNETYTNLYEGDYSQDLSGKLKKGDTMISGENQLIDSLKEQAGVDVSFLYGNMRLITTLRNPGGSRINGTAVESGIYEKLETGKALFVEDYTVSGRDYYIYYQPLINSDGSVIGAIEVAADAAGVKDTIAGQVTSLVLFSLIFVAIATILVTFLSRSMVVTMRNINQFLGKIADGELGAVPDAKSLKRKDELGEIYKISVQLQHALRGIVTDIKESADNLTASANKLAEMALDTQESVTEVYQAVGEISKGAKTQADETTDANDNVIRIGEQIDYITEEVDSLTSYARRMADAEKASEQIIQELDASNENTKESVSKVSNHIVSMNQSIHNITKAVAMIQEIADETDLLSLNASIEAARAGEAGRGFAVVAEQICKLADQSKQSAEEIKQIIAGIMEASGKMVSIMGEVETNMDDQQEKLKETRVKYAAVSEGVENSLYHIDGIRNKMEVLNSSGTAIRDVVEGLSAISEQNAASADSTMQTAYDMSDTMSDLKKSSDTLRQLADGLEEALGKFKV